MLRQVSRDEFSEKGRERYYQLKPQLKEEYSAGDVVLIDPETGDYFVGETTIDAYSKARKKHPGKKFYGAQVGNLAFKMK